MFAYLFVLIAVISRVLPHPWMNFTAVGASLLYFGARRSRWQVVLPLIVLAATDYYLTVFAYSYPFHIQSYLVTWAWYAGVCLLGGVMLRKQTTVLRVVGAVLGSATSFFLLSNFAVWMGSEMYPHTVAGLGACYAAAIPFYGNDLVSTGLLAGCAFGLPVLAHRVVDAMHHSEDKDIAAA
ncbi:MAG: DUF6580 family putative transport protein [Acidobacteriaceae bacterium]